MVRNCDSDLIKLDYPHPVLYRGGQIYTESIFTVYNRWGVIVYNTTGYGISGEWWNGKTTYNNTQVTDGVYYYVLEVFNNVTKEREKYTGDLNIFMSNSSSSNENLKMMNLNNE